MADLVPPDATAVLAALRERGAQRIDPVRFRLIASLLQRAESQQGTGRQWLDDRVATLLGLVSDKVAQAEAMVPAEKAQPAPSELAGLLAHIAQQKPGSAAPITVAGAGAKPMASAASAAAQKPKHDSPVDPTTLQFFRRTWSRLSADQRLAQSRSSLPENAGPLNSQHLVHRSLNVMRGLSPEYFDLFISHVDTLLWLERANEQAAREVGLPPRARGGKKANGAKRG